jgi:murein L,D-transpeptidase YcbB/YkuD
LIRNCTILFLLRLIPTRALSLLLGSFFISPLTGATEVFLADLRQALVDDAVHNCSELPALRTVDLKTALAELYRHNGQEPLWQDPQRLAALKAELARLVDDGLQASDYGFALQAPPPEDYCAELRISSDYMLALEHLSRGRLVQADHEPLWHAAGLPPATVPELTVLAVTGLSADIRAAFEQARPDLPQYRALRAAYADMNRQPPARQPVPEGPLLRPGMSDSRVAQIAALLLEDGFLPDADIPTAALGYRYDEALVQAVRRFQANQGLQTDGIIGPQTIRAMNIAPQQRVQQVLINLERLRWINAQRSDYLLLINVASGHLQLLRGDALLWQARAQTGRPSRPTPALVSYINRITLNPSWTVPPTILRQDMLPQIRRNPDYLETHNMQILDGQGNLLDPQEINWSNPRGIILRQPPGPTNPLGQMVFRLPNPFSVYLHDTPSQHLFEQAGRNVSSGCVRVEESDGLARHLFAGLTESQRERIADQLASGQTHEVALPNGPQVILAYWTAFADTDGRPAFVPDSYGFDQALDDALTGVRVDQPADLAQMEIQAEAGCVFAAG